MSELRLHDTLAGKLTPFVPRKAGEATVYTCGPTTYDVAHVGHARAALMPDLLVRRLRGRGLRVTYVRNVTDVDDKILKRAGETGEEPTALSRRMTELYQKDIRDLGCLEPDVQPKVSDHVADIVALIQKLLANGAAYEVTMPSGARDVYFSSRAFDGYGKLSKQKLEELQVGARVEASEAKRDPLDFALWKGCAPEAWGWDTPLGRGRPGWHIECSAMSARYLGHGFDVHCGGMDLIFPHHENEIAQSESAFPKEGPFARIWIHNGFVNVDKDKMSKSLGNFVTIQQVYDRYDPEALRLFLLTVHYRGPILFDTEKLEDGRVVFPGIAEAERRVDYLYAMRARLEALAKGAVAAGPVPKELAAFETLAANARGRVDAAMDDDLNTPIALAVLAEVAKAANELADLAQKKRKDAKFTASVPGVAAKLLEALRVSLEPLGLLQTAPDAYTARTQARRIAIRGLTAEAIEAKLADRAKARADKDFARSDAIRGELEALGVEVADAPTGTTWRVGV